MKTVNEVLNKSKKELDTAVKNFGIYSLGDKGPHEVMNMNSILNDLRKLKVEEAVEVVKGLYGYRKDGAGEILADFLVDELDLGSNFMIPTVEETTKVVVSNFIDIIKNKKHG